MIKKLTITSALLAFISPVHAFQTEIGGTVDYIDYDTITTPNYSTKQEETRLNLDATYYFNPVNVKNSPLNEAAFLDRASNIKGNAYYQENDNKFDIKSYESKVDYIGAGAGIEYFLPNSNFYVNLQLDYEKYELKYKQSGTKYTGKEWNYHAEIGYLPAPGLLIAAGIQGWDTDNDDGTDPTLRAKYVTQIANHDINLEASAGFGDLDDFSLRGDYYIDKTLSLGVDYYDNDHYDEFGINAKKFFNQKISVEGRLGFGDTEDNYSIRAAYRF